MDVKFSSTFKLKIGSNKISTLTNFEKNPQFIRAIRWMKWQILLKMIKL